MITENNIKNLEKIVNNLSYKDYLQAYHKSTRYLKGRFTPTGRERKFSGYSLSSETLEAYNLLVLTDKKDITKENEEKIKAYLLNIKLTRSELLTDTR